MHRFAATIGVMTICLFCFPGTGPASASVSPTARSVVALTRTSLAPPLVASAPSGERASDPLANSPGVSSPEDLVHGDSTVMAMIVGGLAFLALSYLILIFARRRSVVST